MKRMVKRAGYRVAPPVLYAFIRLLRATVRVSYRHRERIEQAAADPGHYLLGFWHSRFLLMPYVQLPDRPAVVMASRHADAQLLIRTIRPFGFRYAMGSSTRGGRAALREMARMIDEGLDGALTPDGPRGPRRRVKPGIIALAQLTGLPLFPATFSACPARRLRSWDHMMIPRLFSRGLFLYGEPIRVPRELAPGEFETLRLEFETRLNNLTDEADRETGVGLEPPLEPQ